MTDARPAFEEGPPLWDGAGDRPSGRIAAGTLLPRAVGLLLGVGAVLLLSRFWGTLDRIDAVVPLLAATAIGAALVWLAADLIARLDSRWRPDRFGHPRPVRRGGWFGAGLLLLAGTLAQLTAPSGLYGFLPIGAALVGAWRLLGAWRRLLRERGARGAGSREERFRLTTPGIVAVVVAAALMLGAFLGPSNMLLLVCCLIVGPIAADGWYAAAALRRCRVARAAPSIAAAGEVALVELALEYRGRWLPAIQIAAVDRVRNRREDLSASVLFLRAPRGETVTGVYRLEPFTRGPHLLGPITLSTAFPLGLIRREVVVRDEAELLVFPPLGRMTPRWNRARSHADELAHHARPRKGLFEDEFYQLREYRPGDGPRAIHWRSSAKAGELMVRESHESRDRDLVVHLDFHADGPPGLETENVEERAASLAATVIAEHLRRHGGATLSLSVGGAEMRRYLGRAGGDLTGPLTELARAEPGAVAEPGAGAFAAAAEAGPAARRVFLTTRAPDDAALAAAGFRDESFGAAGGGWEIVSARPGWYEEHFHDRD